MQPNAVLHAGKHAREGIIVTRTEFDANQRVSESQTYRLVLAPDVGPPGCGQREHYNGMCRLIVWCHADGTWNRAPDDVTTCEAARAAIVSTDGACVREWVPVEA